MGTDINSLPSQNDLSKEALSALGIFPTIHTTKKSMETTYNEMKLDGRMFAAQCEATWDSYGFDIKISIPMEMSEPKILEVFQSILDDVIKTMQKEKGSDSSVFFA